VTPGTWPRARVAALLAICGATQLWALWPATQAGSWGCDLSLHLAETVELRRAIAGGDAGLWNESANLGFPSAYYYQVLPQLLAAIASVLLGGLVSVVAVFQATILLPHVLLPISVYRAMRLIDARPSEALGAAIAVTAITSTSTWGMGVDSVLTRGIYTQAWAMLFYPLALAHAWRYLRDGTSLVPAIGWTLLTAASHPFVAVCLPIALACVPCWRLSVGRTLRRCALLGGGTLLAGAWMWLPIVVDYGGFGGFPNRGTDEAGLPPRTLLRLVVDGDLLDAGRLPVLTALLAASVALVIRRRAGVALPLLAQGLVFGALIVSGPLAGKTEDDLIPAIRFLAPMQLALAAAAGVGGARLLTELASAWSRRRPASGRALRWAAPAVAIGASLLAAHALRDQVDRHLRPFRLHRAWTGEAFDDLHAVMTRLPRGRVAAAARHGISHRDHWWYYLPAVYGGHTVVRAYGAGALQSSTSYRYLFRNDDLIVAQHARLYDLRYVIAQVPKAPPGGFLFARAGWYGVYLVDGGGLVEPAQIRERLGRHQARDEAVRAWLAGEGPRTLSLLAVSGEPRADGAGAEVRAIRRAPSRIEIDVVVDGDGPAASFLVKESFHPRWRARIDGAATPVLRVAPSLMAVQAGPGRHTIVLEFRRPWWTWWLLIATLGTLVAIAVAERRRMTTCVAG